MNHLQQQLDERRRKLRLSYPKLEELTGLARSTLWNIVNGPMRQPPKNEQVELLAKALDWPPIYLQQMVGEQFGYHVTEIRDRDLQIIAASWEEIDPRFRRSIRRQVEELRRENNNDPRRPPPSGHPAGQDQENYVACSMVEGSSSRVGSALIASINRTNVLTRGPRPRPCWGAASNFPGGMQLAGLPATHRRGPDCRPAQEPRDAGGGRPQMQLRPAGTPRWPVAHPTGTRGSDGVAGTPPPPALDPGRRHVEHGPRHRRRDHRGIRGRHTVPPAGGR